AEPEVTVTGNLLLIVLSPATTLELPLSPDEAQKL
ncbi:hypothetical protein CCACVL1_10601, partial [Corchorus capsularis]